MPYSRSLSAINLAAIASRKAGRPAEAVYLVAPFSRAAIAASLMCCGVSKSGSPAPKLNTVSPFAFISAARLVTARVMEGGMAATV
jgi:hypothetical protein